MAITTLTSGASSSNLSAYSSASVTPTASRLYLAFFVCSATAAPTPTVTVTGCGLTWTLIDRNDTTFTRSGYLFYATGTPSAGAVTFTGSAGMTAGLWVVAEMDGADLSSPIVQFVKARAGGNELSVSQPFDSAVSAANEAIALVGFEGTQEASVPGTGWTLVADEVIGQPSSSLSVQFADPPVQNITASWTTANRWYVIGAEIRAASSGTPAGSGSGSWSFTGSGSGESAPAGSGGGSWAFAGSGSGGTVSAGAGSGSWSFAGAGTGVRTPAGSGSGLAAWAGSGTGSAPSVGGAAGSGSGTWSFTGSGSGARESAGGGAGLAAWAGGGTGTAPAVPVRSGSGAGAWGWVGGGSGVTPGDARNISITVGAGRSRALTAAGASRSITVTGRSRTLTARPRE